MMSKALPGPGDTVFGHRLVRVVGEGGMGVVYEVRAPDGLRLAMKLLRPRQAGSPHAVDAFRAEAMATASVRHESVVRVYRCGLDRGIHYLLMEFVDGPPLEKLLDQGAALPWRTSTKIAIRVARALGHAHALGLVHRDVKPGNILLFCDGRVRLTDFGIVKDISSLRGFLVNGRKVGTSVYASPEQILGKRLAPATDIYSLGATLYHMVCGRPPFTGRNPRAVMAGHVKLDPVPAVQRVKGLPKALSNAIDRMLAKRQTDRFESMNALAGHLEMVLDGKVAILPRGPSANPEALRKLAARRGPPSFRTRH